MTARELALAQAPSVDWSQTEREAREAGVAVALFVGVPAVVAAGSALLIFALAWFVLLAPLVAAVLTWMAWRYGRAGPPGPDPGSSDPDPAPRRGGLPARRQA